MKRFTETTKWRDPWYRKLTPVAKLLFLWLADHCDNAGVIDLDLESAAFDIGQSVDQSHIVEIGERLQRLSCGKWHLVKFVRFQFGELKPTSIIHNSILKLIHSHGLNSIPCASHVNPIGNPFPIPSQCHQEKDKDKDKDRGTSGNSWFESTGELIEKLGFNLYNRAEGQRPAYDEEQSALEIIKRQDWKSEMEQLLVLGRTIDPKDRRFEIPKTLLKLLTNWHSALDIARTYKRHEKPAKHNPRNDGIAIGPTDYGEAAKRKMERQALESENRRASQAQGT